ncbi:class I SAM-dependent methyltransferase [Novipirellula maiorica]|nr:class I SAM-dependent methyltransferase [Rhodopirellula maiorica]
MINRIAKNIAWRAGKWSKRSASEYLFRSVGMSPSLKVTSYTTQSELLALYSLAKELSDRPVAVEIGAHLGASARYLAAGLKPIGGHLYCIDTWMNDAMPDEAIDVFSQFEENTFEVKDLVTPVRGYSTALLDDWPYGLLDFAFVDGDHSYEAVRDDIAVLLPHMKSIATIAFHDFFSHPGVAKAVGELLANGDWRAGGSCENLLWVKR